MSWLTIRGWNPQEKPTLASKQENEFIDIEKCYYIFNFIKVSNRQTHLFLCYVSDSKNGQKHQSTSSEPLDGDSTDKKCFLKRHAVLTICGHWNIKEITYKIDKNPLWKHSLETAKEDGKE